MALTGGPRIGVVYPHTELGGDPAAVRDFAVAAEALGFRHIMAFDHVVGAHPETPGYERRYTSRTPFTDPFVLFAYLAGITRRLEFVSGVLILPQRQTALVAKQAADVAVLSGGRLRLGVGTGWNQREYSALGVPFSGRGRRQEEQVQLLRRLWSEETVRFESPLHLLEDVGVTPRPAAPIPIWFGGNAAAVLRRAARIGDGWFPLARPGADLEPLLEILHRELESHGRTPASFGVEGFLNVEGGDPDRWGRQVEAWAAGGATHLCLRTQPVVLPEARPGYDAAYHIRALEQFAEACFARGPA